MNKDLKKSIDNLESKNDTIRLNALQSILENTEEQVDWVYEVWDHLFGKLDDENSYQRSIAIRVLCNLVKSDSENRILVSLNRLLAHTRDEKFVTSRICIQSIWKVAASNSQTREIIVDHLEKLFKGCMEGKHYNLIRQDIIHSICLLYDKEKDNRILKSAEELIKKEKEEKYRKKYEDILNFK
jgi:hypothetical protein